MDKITLKTLINGDSSLRNLLRKELGISYQHLYSIENAKRPIPLKYFIKLKKWFPDIDECQCPAYEEVFSKDNPIKKNYLNPLLLLKNPEKVRVSL